MSEQHPIIAVTGPSGAGTSTVTKAFSTLFRREGINATFVAGDAFRRYDRQGMKQALAEAEAAGRTLSHYGPDANQFEVLETLFRMYGETGQGKIREYVTAENSHGLPCPPGTFTPWQDIPQPSELLFYEGLHGGVVAQHWTRRKMSASHNPLVVQERRNVENHKGTDVAQHVDLLIGVVPVINLEWIQKMHRDTRVKGKTTSQVTNTLLRSMRDYTHFITPQFSMTDINFQRIPLVDTSNPLLPLEVPTQDESMMVVRFREPSRYDFPYLLRMISDAYMTRPNTMLIPGGELRHALETICGPLVAELRRNAARR